MKKRRTLPAVLALVLGLACAFGACVKPGEPEVLELTFDSSTPYFTAADNALFPVEGSRPASGEEALTVAKRIKITASRAADFRVKIGLTSETRNFEGLKLLVSDGTCIDFADGAVVYESGGESGGAEFTLTVFLTASADEDLSGARVTFDLELEYAS